MKKSAHFNRIYFRRCRRRLSCIYPLNCGSIYLFPSLILHFTVKYLLTINFFKKNSGKKNKRKEASFFRETNWRFLERESEISSSLTIDVEDEASSKEAPHRWK